MGEADRQKMIAELEQIRGSIQEVGQLAMYLHMAVLKFFGITRGGGCKQLRGLKRKAQA